MHLVDDRHEVLALLLVCIKWLKPCLLGCLPGIVDGSPLLLEFRPYVLGFAVLLGIELEAFVALCVGPYGSLDLFVVIDDLAGDNLGTEGHDLATAGIWNGDRNRLCVLHLVPEGRSCFHDLPCVLCKALGRIAEVDHVESILVRLGKVAGEVGDEDMLLDS